MIKSSPMPEHLTFPEWLVWQAPAMGATLLIVLAVVVPILIHLNRKGY